MIAPRLAQKFLLLFLLLPLLSFATISYDIALPGSPGSLVVNPISGKVYSSSMTSTTLMVVDAANTVTNLQLGAQVTGLALNPSTNKIYVTTTADFVVVNGSDNTLTHIALGSGLSCVTVDTTTNRIYVGNHNAGVISMIDGSNNSVIASVTIATTVQAIAVNPLTQKIYVTLIDSSSVAVIDATSNSISDYVDVGYHPFGIAVNPATNMIYVANLGDAFITVIDGATLQSFNLDGALGLIDFAIDSVRNKIYISCYNSDKLMLIDGATNAVTLLTVPGSPSAPVVNPITGKVYFGSSATHAVVILDPSNNNLMQSVPSGPVSNNGYYPQAVALNPITGRIYAANGGWYTMSVIDETYAAVDNQNYFLSTGHSPQSLALNQVTNTVYSANRASNTVGVFDDTLQISVTVPVGNDPVSLTTDVVNGETYVVNRLGNSVSIINADHTVQTVAVGNMPLAVATNPVTHRAYVANSTDNTVSVIDRAVGTIGTITVGTGPQALVVNPANGKIYVANTTAGSVSIIDGASATIDATVLVGTTPTALAIDTLSNRVYVINHDSNNLSVIDGNAIVATIALGGPPRALAVNANTKRVYVTNSPVSAPNRVSVIDSGNNTVVAQVTVGPLPNTVAVDPATNQIFVASFLDNTVTVIDGQTLKQSIYQVGTSPYALVVNSVTHRAYVSNSANDYMSTISQQVRHDSIPLQSNPGLRFHTSAATQNFLFTPSSAYSPYALPATGVYYQLDNLLGSWMVASANGDGSFSGNFSALSAGTHTLYAFAVDGLQAKNNSAPGNPMIGDMAAYAFNVIAAPTLNSATPGNGAVGNSYNFSYSGNSIAPMFYQVTVGSLPPGLTLAPNGTISGMPTLAGLFSGTVTASNGALPDPSQSFSINVTQAPSFINTPPNGVISTPYTFDYQVLGTPAPTFVLLSGSLPSGLSLSSSGHIGGTPSATGIFNATISIDNGVGVDASQDIVLTIGQAPLITTSAAPGGNVATAYSFVYAASGFPASNFSLQSGTLPPGLSLSTAGILSGTPTIPGLYSGSIKAGNGIGSDATQNFSITITQAPSITSAAPPGGHFSVAYSFSYNASGSPAPSFALGSGILPPGLTLTPAGLLSGKPTLAGTYTGTVLASNGVGSGASQNFSIVIDTDRIFANGFEVP
ncbi:YncE family protein [Pseudolysobacter antarcticus]|nr:YncE family protein [Pseudolysobacter antarcticus]